MLKPHSTKMYKTRVKQWGDFDKHKRASDMRLVVRKKRERDVVGKKSAFVVRNNRITAREIARYVARKINSESVLQEQVQDVSTPDHIVCFTPSTTSDAENDDENAREPANKDFMPTARSAYLRPLEIRKLNTFDSLSSCMDMVPRQKHRPVRAVQCTSIPLVLTPPDTLLKHEVLFADISSYFKGAIESKIWVLSDRPVWQQICLSISLPDPESSAIMTRSWQCILDMTKRTTGPYSFESIRSETNLICQIYHNDSPHQELLLRELLTKYENGTNKLNDAGVHVADYCADSMLDQGKYSEAETLLGGSLRQAQRFGCLVNCGKPVLWRISRRSNICNTRLIQLRRFCGMQSICIVKSMGWTAQWSDSTISWNAGFASEADTEKLMN